MSDIDIKDLPPAPFFARFLERQECGTMTREEMQAVRGGAMVTAAYPSDSVDVPLDGLPEQIQALVQEALDGFGSIPEFPMPSNPYPEYVTMAYPSDSDIVG